MSIIVKRAIKFFLHKTFGHFLKEKLDLSQLEVDLKSGTVHLKHLELNNDVINNVLGELPFTIKSGWIEHAWVTIPLKHITSNFVDNCKLELEGLCITLVPGKAKTSLAESKSWGVHSDYGTRSQFTVSQSWDGTDSAVLEEEEESFSLAGERELTQIIDQLLLILEKVRIKNLNIDIEYFSPSLGKEVILSALVPSFEYSDVTRLASNLANTTGSPSKNSTSRLSTSPTSTLAWNPSVLVKCIKLSALVVQIREKEEIEEEDISGPTLRESLSSSSSKLRNSSSAFGSNSGEINLGDTILILGNDNGGRKQQNGDNSNGNHKQDSEQGYPDKEEAKQREEESDLVYLKFRKHKRNITIPELDVECAFRHLKVILSAEQVKLLMELIDSVSEALKAPVPRPPSVMLRESSGAQVDVNDCGKDKGVRSGKERTYNRGNTTTAPHLPHSPSKPRRNKQLNQSDSSDDGGRLNRTQDLQFEDESLSDDGSSDDADDTFFECTQEDDWFRESHAGEEKVIVTPTDPYSQTELPYNNLVNLKVNVHIMSGSLTLVYDDLPDTRAFEFDLDCIKWSMKNQERLESKEASSTERRTRHEENVSGAYSEPSPFDFHEEFSSEHLTFEFKNLEAMVQKSLLQTKTCVTVGTFDIVEHLYKTQEAEDSAAEDAHSKYSADISPSRHMPPPSDNPMPQESQFVRSHLVWFRTPSKPEPVPTEPLSTSPSSPTRKTQTLQNLVPSTGLHQFFNEYKPSRVHTAKPHIQCNIVHTNKRIDDPSIAGYIFDDDISVQLQELSINWDYKLMNRLENFARIFETKGSSAEASHSEEKKAQHTVDSGEQYSFHGFDGLKRSPFGTTTRDDILNSLAAISVDLGNAHTQTKSQSSETSKRIAIEINKSVCIVFRFPEVAGQKKRPEKVVVRISDQKGPRVTTHIHGDQPEITWFVDFDQFTATIDRGVERSVYRRKAPGRPFFEAQMRNTQNEAVTPLEISVKTSSWKPTFTFVHDISLSQSLPSDLGHDDTAEDGRSVGGSFSNFFSLFQGRGHIPAEAEATDLSKIVVTLRFPSSHLELAKSDYNILAALLSAISSGGDSNHSNPKSRESLDTNMKSSTATYLQNAFALHVFFSQGNWVFRENSKNPEQKRNRSAKDVAHRYELEFVKFHLFQLVQFEGRDINYTVLTLDDFIVHDTVSYDNTTPVLERIPRSKKEDSATMIRALISSNAESKLTDVHVFLQEMIVHHRHGLNWLLRLIDFFKTGEEGKPTESKTAKQRQPSKGKEKEGSIYTDISDDDYTTGCRFLEKARNDVSTFKVAVTVLDAEIDYLPTLLPSRAILAIKYLNMTSNDIKEDAPRKIFSGLVRDISVYLIDNTRSRSLSNSSVIESRERSSSRGKSAASSLNSLASYWENKGFIKIVAVDFLNVAIVINENATLLQRTPDLEITLSSPEVPSTFSLSACPDSLQTLLDLIAEISVSEDMLSGTPAPAPVEVQQSEIELSGNVVWDELDVNAFGSKKQNQKDSKPPKVAAANKIVIRDDYDSDSQGMLGSGRFVIRDDYMSPSPPSRSATPVCTLDDTDSDDSESYSRKDSSSKEKQNEQKEKGKYVRSNNYKEGKKREKEKQIIESSDEEYSSSSDVDMDWGTEEQIKKSSNKNRVQKKDKEKSKSKKQHMEKRSMPQETGIVDGADIGLEEGRRYMLLIEDLLPTPPSSPSPSVTNSPPPSFTLGSSTRPAALSTKKSSPQNEVTNEPKVRWFMDKKSAKLSDAIIEDFLGLPNGDEVTFKLPNHYPRSVTRFFIQLNAIIKLCDGLDWGVSNLCGSSLSSASTSPSASSSTSCEYPYSSNEGVPMGSSSSSSNLLRSAASNAQGSRNEDVYVELHVNSFRAQFDEIEAGKQYVRRIVVALDEVELIDHIPSSDVHTLLCYDRDNPRNPDSSMFSLEMECVRPDVDRLEAEEWRMRVGILPLRLYIDQEALEFLGRFFSSMDPSPSIPQTEPMYFQNCEIKPISLKVDYLPKQLDYNALYGDNKVAFLAKAVPLRGAVVHLRRAKLKARGWDELLGKRLVEAYVPHFCQTQLFPMLTAVAPIRSILSLTSGVSDLIYTPVEHWQKDGRILTGLQKGTSSALHKFALETLNVTANLASGVQYVLESADYYLGGSGGSESGNVYTNQISGAQEGIQHAYSSLSREIGKAAHRIVAVPLDEYNKHGTTGYLSSLVSGVPIAILRPMIGVTEGVTKTLIGVQKSLDPSLEKEMTTKFKNRPGGGSKSQQSSGAKEGRPDEEEDEDNEEDGVALAHGRQLNGRGSRRSMDVSNKSYDNDGDGGDDDSGAGLLIELDSDSDF